MYKLLPGVLMATALMLSGAEQPKLAQAGTCVAATSCGPQPVQFIPGQRITVEVANLTSGVLRVQQVYGTDALPVSPGQVLSFLRGGTVDPNFSVVFWDAQGAPLQVNIRKPEARLLRIEVRPGGSLTGDRSVYLRDDGRINIL
ncbi:MAG: hypothetical protein KME06_06485 [Kastovskya adunca ATA6-11-RM4]|jgi:hypothetical protein|nr:hypothetical protein [Kastovskya adunca ATA6-11-RM4]